MRISERRIFDVNFSDDPHLYFFLVRAVDLTETLDQTTNNLFIFFICFTIERLFDFRKTFLSRPVRIPDILFIRLALVIQRHERITVKNAESELQQQ